jgi:hypothetical protein
MRKPTKLKTALLLAATVNVSYAAEVCFPPAECQEVYEALECLQNRLDSQQKQITELKKDNQRLTNIVKAMKTEFNKHHILRYFDNGDGTVSDNTQSGLTWLKNANCFGTQNWETAKQSAANLATGQCGLKDGSTAGMWRLPTRDEWVTMMDNRYKNPALSNRAGTAQWREGDAFSGVQPYYWSSTESAYDSGYAWGVYLHDGDIHTYDEYDTYHVWPVRRRQ